MRDVFDPNKLSADAKRFEKLAVLVIGAGAVGTYVMEHLAKMNVGRLTAMDFDTFTEENAAKHAALIHVPEDAGRNKALAVAERTRPYMVSGGEVNGIDGDVRCLGPEALRDYDVVIMALDNYAAKIYVNEIWKELSDEERPLMIFGGTNGESAQSHCLDGREFCVRCMFDESWLVDGVVRTSCTGPQYRQETGAAPIVRTSGLASAMSAELMCEHFRGWVLCPEKAVNTSLSYRSFPNIGIRCSRPMAKKNCPDCEDYGPVEQRENLPGDVMHTTLGEALEMIRGRIEGDFGLDVHGYSFNQIGYTGIVVHDYCHCCGAPVTPCAHAGDLSYEDVLCEDCRTSGRKAEYDPNRQTVDPLMTITPDECPEELRDRTLFELGWPVGARLKVSTMNGMDALDELDDALTYTYFVLEGDAELMKADKVLTRFREVASYGKKQ